MKTTGFILINKPKNLTSHDVVDSLRKITGLKKIGHAGTLDPFATGLLIVAIGREATREISKFVKLDKEYLAKFYLGAETDTYDLTGKITKEYAGPTIESTVLNQALTALASETEQISPMYSAKKIKGRKLYELARQNIEIERTPQAITIFDLVNLNYDWPIVSLKIHCSSGTYIRSLAFDLGRLLNCGAYVVELTRTKIGQFNLTEAVDLKQLTSDNWSNFLIDSKV